jgi:hypothetical protein
MAKFNPKAAYLLLLAVQIAGAFLIIWKELPDLRQLALRPGHQLPYIPYDDFATIGAVVAMQAAYWYRVRRVPIPFQRSSPLLSHLLLFLGRLSFIFGGWLFAVVFFRHLPGIEQGIDILLMARRALTLVGSLFALFCVTLELERLGRALWSNQRN